MGKGYHFLGAPGNSLEPRQFGSGRELVYLPVKIA